jgi:SagB-type dehydrogenase family enzyme
MIPLKDATSLSLLYHLNSEPWLNDEAYRGAPSQSELPDQETPPVFLPMPEAPTSVLSPLFHRRRSCRDFAPVALTLAQLSGLTAAAYGVVETVTLGDQAGLLRRSVPSAGGLFPLEVYLLCQRVTGADDGLYHYDGTGHSLNLLQEGKLFPVFGEHFYTYPFIERANLIALFAANFSRTQKKYGPRGYRYILIEAGHAAQNLCLAAAEMGLASLCMGGFVDSGVNRLLKFDDQKKGVVYSVAIGVAAESH